MNTIRKSVMRWRALLPIVALLATSSHVRGEIRSLSFGIDLNCPFGLGECWPQVFHGLVKLPGGAVAEEADAETGTCVVRPHGGKMLDPRKVAKFIEDIRIGARLRGMEAIADGRLEKRGEELVLVVSERDVFRLAPLRKKVQWDFRSKEHFKAESWERSAYARLAAQFEGEPAPMRLIGPVVTEPGASGRLILEVREFYRFGDVMPELERSRLGIRVNSPYGLTEPWGAVRRCLVKLPGIESVPGVPELESSTVEVGLDRETPIDTARWSTEIARAGAGAELFGVEISVRGRLVKRLGQLALELPGADGWLALAPITRNVRWDHRKRREILPNDVEQKAYHDLLARWSPRMALVRVVGPLVKDLASGTCVLEVREFGTGAGTTTLTGATGKDFSAPVAPRAVRAKGPAEKIIVRWAENRERDLAGYHVYRASEVTGPFTRVSTKLLRERSLEVSLELDSHADWFFVTAIDSSGNESAKSLPASAAPPRAPVSVTAKLRGGTVLLNWQDNRDHDLDTYSVYRASKPGGPFGEIASVLYESSYSNGGLKSGTTYYYVVTAVDSSYNESAYSRELVVSVP